MISKHIPLEYGLLLHFDFALSPGANVWGVELNFGKIREVELTNKHQLSYDRVISRKLCSNNK